VISLNLLWIPFLAFVSFQLVTFDKLISNENPTVNRGYVVVGSVPLIYWDKYEPFSKEISIKREPIVLRNTIVDTWRARSTWCPEYFINKNKQQRFKVNRSRQSSTFVYFDSQRPMSLLEEVQWRPPSEEVMMTMEELFLSLRSNEQNSLSKESIGKNNSSETFYYFSGDIFGFSAEMIEDLSPFDYLVEIMPSDRDLSKDSAILTVWIGGGGTTTHTHYDAFHNFFVQLYGRKRFLLFPPSAHSLLYLYPNAHPSYRQSQLNFDELDIRKFPRFHNVSALEILLEAGDVLYLPPYWFHRVIAEELSISVSFWCDSEELQVYLESIKREPLPFEEHWTPKQLALATSLFLRKLIDELESVGKIMAGQFLETLIEQRYVPIFGVFSTERRDLICTCNDFENCMDEVEQYLTHRIDHTVSNLKILFEEISVHAGNDIHDILLGNYIETVVEFVLGVEQVNPFVQSCLLS